MSSDNDQPPPETAIIPAAPASPCPDNPLSSITPPPVPPTRYSVSLRKDVSPLFKRLKQWSWRVTGLYVTAVIVGLLFGFAQDVIAIPAYLAERFADFLGWLGYSPTDRTYLTPVARILWILLITGFRFWQAVGLLFYCLFFWLILLVYLVTRFTRKTPKSPPQPKPPASVWKRLQAVGRLRFRAILTTFLVAWFLLYGSTASRKVLGLAVVAGFLLLAGVIWSALRRTRVPKNDPTPFQLMVQAGHSWFEQARAVVSPASHENATKALDTQRNNGKFLVWILGGLRYGGLDGLLWGFSLMGYILWPMILVAVAVATWALAFKFLLAPAFTTWEAAVSFGASGFLPNVEAPSVSPPLPLWVTLGSGFTAVFVLVLYVALLSALLTRRQSWLSEAVARTRSRLRWYSIQIGRTRRWLRHCRERLG